MKPYKDYISELHELALQSPDTYIRLPDHSHNLPKHYFDLGYLLGEICKQLEDKPNQC